MAPSYTPPPSAAPLDLRSAFLKVKWAKQQIDNLGNARIAFLGTNPYFGVPKFNPETNRTQFILKNVPEIPAEIPLLLGDAAHNLRTALDHLACELARSTGLPIPRFTFPSARARTRTKPNLLEKQRVFPQRPKNSSTVCVRIREEMICCGDSIDLTSSTSTNSC